MNNNTIRFISPVGRGMDAGVTSDEPSHIHIARPSRLARRDNTSNASLELTDQVRNLADAEITVQAA